MWDFARAVRQGFAHQVVQPCGVLAGRVEVKGQEVAGCSRRCLSALQPSLGDMAQDVMEQRVGHAPTRHKEHRVSETLRPARQALDECIGRLTRCVRHARDQERRHCEQPGRHRQHTSERHGIRVRRLARAEQTKEEQPDQRHAERVADLQRCGHHTSPRPSIARLERADDDSHQRAHAQALAYARHEEAGRKLPTDETAACRRGRRRSRQKPERSGDIPDRQHMPAQQRHEPWRAERSQKEPARRRRIR